MATGIAVYSQASQGCRISEANTAGVVAWYAGSATPRGGLIQGMTVVLGCLPMPVIFVMLLQHANVQPSLLRALVVAGLVYRVAFGGVGGALAAILAEERAP